MSTLRASRRIAARLTPCFALALCFAASALCGPIHKAASSGNQKQVIALLQQDPSLVESRDSLGFTPLHLAAKFNQPAMVALLLANGADVNALSQSRETPLSLALLSYYHKEVVEQLITHGADVNATVYGGANPLMVAVGRNLVYDVQLLLANGANPNAANPRGFTAVHMAVNGSRTEVLKILLDYGADPNAKDSMGYTPLFYAKAGINAKIVELLVAHGGHK